LLACLPLILGILFSLLSPALHTSALAPSNYTNYLIDDSVFRDNTAMSASDIETFLTNEGSGLKSFMDVENCGSTSGPHYAYYATYYSCGNSRLAAQIIYDASQAYGINPRVILATLQKEQSLVTDPSPAASQINFAMGYGCPDSGGCSVSGFFNQIDNGTWQLRTDMELGSGNNWWGYTPASYPCNGATRYYSAALKAGYAVTFYDDNGTPYNGFTLPNMSTATLYCYTPHVYNNPAGINGNPQYGSVGEYYSGSYNFVKAFDAWWGTTYGPTKVTGSPGSVSWGSGRIDVFARGGDGVLWQKYFDGNAGGWGPWAPLDVSISSSPTVSTWGVGRLDVFYVGSDGALDHYWYGSGAWQSVESLGQPPGVTISGSPAAISWGSGRIDVFVRGSDGALWQKWYSGAAGGWQSWVRLGGDINSSPTVTTWGLNRLDVFSTGPAGDLQHYWFDSNGWHSWESLGSGPGVTLSTAPGGAAWAAGRLDVFGRGSDGVLWQKWFDASGWHPWVRFTGVLNSAPTISSWGPSRLDEFSTGPAGDLQHYWFDSNGWHSWESLGIPIN
jgi:hypothetical protein